MFYPHLENINKLCQIVLYAPAKKISFQNLKAFYNSILTLGSDDKFEDVLEFGIKIGLILIKKNNYSLTENGNEFVKIRNKENIKLSNKQKIFFIKHILLRCKYLHRELSNFLKGFIENDRLGTYVYTRSFLEPSQFNQKAIFYNYLGLIQSINGQFLVNKFFLFEINTALALSQKISEERLKAIVKYKEKNGKEAEQFILDYEQQRLERLRRFDLAKNVKKISDINITVGYDIESFDGGQNDFEYNRFIEVKCTDADYINFFWTFNEVEKAKELKEKYWLYILINFSINKKNLNPTLIRNPYKKIFKNKRFRRNPVVYHIEQLNKQLSCSRKFN